LLFIESPESEAELTKIGKTFAGVPLVANMVEGGRTPILSRAELEASGFKLAIFPTAGFLAAGAALRSVYGELRANGSSKAWSGELYPFDDFSRLMGFEQVWTFERDHAEG
jgi:2-methylisocitrate lyase-like PEP mutase family enzyme